MKKTFAKILSIVMLVSMCCSMLGIVAMADSVTDPVTGNVTTTEQVDSSSQTVENVTTEETVFEFTVTDPSGELLSTGGYTEVTETSKETIEGEFVEDEVPNTEFLPEIPETTVGAAPELEVELGNGGSATDSEAPEITAPEGSTVVDGEGQTTVTTTVTDEKVVGVENKPGTPVTDENGVTTTVTTQDTTTVKAETTETVVVTDRTLEAVLEKGDAASNSKVSEEVNADVEALNIMLKEMGIIEDDLDAEDAAAVLKAIEDNDSSNDIVAAMNEKGELKQTEKAEEAATAPTIVVSDVTFKVGDKAADSEAYTTEISFKVVIENSVENGKTTVTVIDGEGNKLQSSDLSALAMVDGKYVMPDLQLSENVNYNLQFDFAAEQSLGADAYVYNATIQVQDGTKTEYVNKVYGAESGYIPSQSDVHKSNGGNHTAKIHSDYLPDGYYTVVYKGTDKETGEERVYTFDAHQDGNLFVVQAQDIDGIFFPYSKQDKNATYDLEVVDKNGVSNKLTIKWKQQNDNPNGQKQYDATGHGYYKEEVSVPNYREETYNYGFSNDKTQSVTASQNMTLNFSVEESTVTSSSVSSSETKIDTEKTTVKQWVKDEWEEPVEKPEEPEVPEDPEEPGQPNPPVPVPLMDNGEVIEDEPVPLAQAPSTGSVSVVFAIAAAVSGMGLAGIAISSKRKED